jgi:hypothetical protein
VGGSGIVDENVDRAELLLDLGDDAFGCAFGSYVCHDRYSFAFAFAFAFALRGCDLGDEREKFGLTASDGSNGGPGGCEGFGDRTSNAARRACYQGLGLSAPL